SRSGPEAATMPARVPARLASDPAGGRRSSAVRVIPPPGRADAGPGAGADERPEDADAETDADVDAGADPGPGPGPRSGPVADPGPLLGPTGTVDDAFE